LSVVDVNVPLVAASFTDPTDAPANAVVA
jgi:hypothetical protein